MKQLISDILASIPMWTRMLILFIGLTVIAIASWLGFVKYPEDNKIEEAVEEAIKDETGLDIDITPESLEESKK
jgi:hypothetical protein